MAEKLKGLSEVSSVAETASLAPIDQTATLAAIKNPDGLPFVLKTFKDAEPGVRRGAYQAAVAFGDRPETTKALLEGLDEKDASSKMAAHEALKAIKGKAAPYRTRASWEETLK